MTKVVVYAKMRGRGGAEELVLDESRLPAGWATLTDDARERAMAPYVEEHIAASIEAGWYERP